MIDRSIAEPHDTENRDIAIVPVVIPNFGAQVTGSIYQVLARHQREEDWANGDVMSALQTAAARFNVEFKLDVTEISLCLDRLPANRYGHYRVGHNGFGLKGEIALNTKYMFGVRAPWHILGTLLHEMLHAWQHAHGKPSSGNHHNAEFRDKARSLGLLIDERGVTSYAANGPFKQLLKSVGIEVPCNEWQAVSERSRGQSKIKKWSCGCTNVRVAIADFQAQCLKCGNRFAPDASHGRCSKSA